MAKNSTNSNLRKTVDGSLIAPKRGNPPPAPEGYMQDPTNKYRYLPITKSCKYLEQVFLNSGCCGVVIRRRCKLKCREVAKVDCLECNI